MFLPLEVQGEEVETRPQPGDPGGDSAHGTSEGSSCGSGLTGSRVGRHSLPPAPALHPGRGAERRLGGSQGQQKGGATTVGT